MKALFLTIGFLALDAAEWSTEELREKSDTVPFFEDCWDACGGVAGPCKARGLSRLDRRSDLWNTGCLSLGVRHRQGLLQDARVVREFGL